MSTFHSWICIYSLLTIVYFQARTAWGITLAVFIIIVIVTLAFVMPNYLAALGKEAESESRG